jgi:hypothetical protein
MTPLVFALILIILLLALTAAVFLLGYRVGTDGWQAELTRVRLEAAQAQRDFHRLTREAFVAMAEHAERRRET